VSLQLQILKTFCRDAQLRVSRGLVPSRKKELSARTAFYEWMCNANKPSRTNEQSYYHAGSIFTRHRTPATAQSAIKKSEISHKNLTLKNKTGRAPPGRVIRSYSSPLF
jgi:hypothetical protein